MNLNQKKQKPKQEKVNQTTQPKEDEKQVGKEPILTFPSQYLSQNGQPYFQGKRFQSRNPISTTQEDCMKVSIMLSNSQFLNESSPEMRNNETSLNSDKNKKLNKKSLGHKSHDPYHSKQSRRDGAQNLKKCHNPGLLRDAKGQFVSKEQYDLQIQKSSSSKADSQKKNTQLDLNYQKNISNSSQNGKGQKRCKNTLTNKIQQIQEEDGEDTVRNSHVSPFMRNPASMNEKLLKTEEDNFNQRVSAFQQSNDYIMNQFDNTDNLYIEIYKLVDAMEEEEDFDRIEQFLWQQKRQADKLAKLYRDMRDDILEKCNQIDQQQESENVDEHRKEEIKKGLELKQEDEYESENFENESILGKRNLYDSMREDREDYYDEEESEKSTYNKRDKKMVVKTKLSQQSLNLLNQQDKLRNINNYQRSDYFNIPTQTMDVKPIFKTVNMKHKPPPKKKQIKNDYSADSKNYVDDEDENNRSYESNYSNDIKYSKHKKKLLTLKQEQKQQKHCRENHFNFKNDLATFVRAIQDDNETLFQSQAIKKITQGDEVSGTSRNKRIKPARGFNMVSQSSDESTYNYNGGGLNNGMNQFRYENENFFETERDELIKITGLFDYKQFWQRINSFFNLKIGVEVKSYVKNFYNYQKDQHEEIINEFSSQQGPLEANVLETPQISNHVLDLLKLNDPSFNEDIMVESPHHFRINEFLKEFTKQKDNTQPSFSFMTSKVQKDTPNLKIQRTQSLIEKPPQTLNES